MVPIPALWLPILLSAVAVFVVSAVIHMALRYHESDISPLPDEDKVLDALRENGVAPGNYFFPFATGKQFGDEAVIERFKKGPVGILNVLPAGPPAMGKNLLQWFVFSLLVSAAVAYVTGRTIAPGADYLAAFRVSGTVAFLAYAGALPLSSIWFGRKWSATAKHMLDGFVYGLLTAGMFGWLWP